jgi:outer membrane protein assembly factor BamD
VNKIVLVFVTLSLQLFISCSTPEITGKTEAEKLYKEAQTLVKSGRYLLATEKLNLIRSKYPYSYYSTFAELMAADVLFSQEGYEEAAAAYIVFKDYHPRHEKIPYVLSRIGESFFKQIPDSHDRDLAPAFESMKYYNFLTRSFPKSEYIGDAQKKIEHCEKMIRNKERYIADFYFKTGVYDAARHRYKAIVERFALAELVDHALVRSIRSSIKLMDRNFCHKNNSFFNARISDNKKDEFKIYMNKCLKMVATKKGESVEKL